jgi:hypothetical protein
MFSFDDKMLTRDFIPVQSFSNARAPAWSVLILFYPTKSNDRIHHNPVPYLHLLAVDVVLLLSYGTHSLEAATPIGASI